MKKILAIAMTVAMILSMGVVFAGAADEYHPNGGFSGAYANGSKADFSPVGEIQINWVADAATKIKLDGSLAEWTDYTPVVITPNNMISWVGGQDKATAEAKGEGAPDATMPEGWQMSAYFLGDKDYFYVGFYITDPDVVPGEAANLANYAAGDAFQINIDFGKKLGEIIKNDPETASLMGNMQNIFYSFCYAGDGVETVIMRQSSDNDRPLNNVGPYWNENAEDNVDGVIQDDVHAFTAKTEEGWSAEFVLPWALMYDDYATKGWLENIEDSRIYIGGDDKKPLEIGMALYYLGNSTNEDGTIAVNDWAAGTGSGLLNQDTDCPVVTWDAYDNGISAVLEADPDAGIEFTCPNIHVMIKGETEPPTEAPTDPPPTEAPTKAPETDAPATDAPTDAATDAATGDAATNATTEAPAKGGCASVIGMGAVAVLAAAAAAVVLKKKD